MFSVPFQGFNVVHGRIVSPWNRLVVVVPIPSSSSKICSSQAGSTHAPVTLHLVWGAVEARARVCVYMFFVPIFLCVAPSRLNGCRVMVMAHIPMVPLTDLLLVCLLLPVCTWRKLIFGTLDIKRTGVVRCITSCVGDETFFYSLRSFPFTAHCPQGGQIIPIACCTPVAFFLKPIYSLVLARGDRERL